MHIPGIHHITAIASDPQRNLDFYAGVLGLRLVKLTVNFDDPGTYHFYYGDQWGTPGTILTFFPWPGASRGRQGTGQATSIAFSVPAGSLPHWAERLQASISVGRIRFPDPDGLPLELVADGESGGTTISGFHGVTLSGAGYESTAALLMNTFGYRLASEDGNRFRYEAKESGKASHIDLLCQPDARAGAMGAGTIHHVAFRAETDEIQRRWQAEIGRLHFNVTPVLDRQYFQSIYFREPGGVLFEIATDPPGFATDETLQDLGTNLKLPPWLEPQRAEIERALPSLRMPK